MMDLRNIKEAKSARQGIWEVKVKEGPWRMALRFPLGQPGRGRQQSTGDAVGSGPGARKREAELSFRDDESEVPLGPPCEDGGLDLGYLNLERERERERG